jgi:hypothetical protein
MNLWPPEGVDFESLLKQVGIKIVRKDQDFYDVLIS